MPRWAEAVEIQAISQHLDASADGYETAGTQVTQSISRVAAELRGGPPGPR